MKITLPTGAVVEGTPEQVTEILNFLNATPNPTLYYKSESRGYILIKEMDTNHLRNAILKQVKEWTSYLYTLTDPREVVEEIVSGIENATFSAMLKELNTREAE